ncbi:MAG TPA: hypothetical protein VHK47_20185, partial [Polyangia bacterium]|nr:hypothetical protein [Polyangia bacterium]
MPNLDVSRFEVVELARRGRALMESRGDLSEPPREWVANYRRLRDAVLGTSDGNLINRFFVLA